ncbi:MAG: hypothetical protein QNK03_18745 [Myxococcota bacterium]|nr:hypothetical protein [Myxococcota bacterium]
MGRCTSHWLRGALIGSVAVPALALSPAAAADPADGAALAALGLALLALLRLRTADRRPARPG